MSEPVIDVLYGFVRVDSGYTRWLPDGSIELGCRVRTYDNKPSEPEHLVSDEMHWNGVTIGPLTKESLRLLPSRLLPPGSPL